MPRNRPATTGYERLAQADQLSDASDDDDDDTHALAASYASLQPASAPGFAPISAPRPYSGMTSPKYSLGTSAPTRPGRGHHGRPARRLRSNSGVDLKAINARLERWADEIAAKFKRGKGGRKPADDEPLEIHHSVFQAPEGMRPATAETLAAQGADSAGDVMSRAEFEAVVDGVRRAIQKGTHPRMISQGSSGSYFARNTEGKVVGVFKPKDEEPYAAGNPKWNKWIHRNLFPCCFGRACLIPNLSYVSEAAAYVLDCQLRTHMVPYTDVVYLSSKSFHYPFWDRYNHSRNRKPLPAKPGSFQVFLKGFKDANVFLREHPWPDQYLSGFRTNDPHRKRKRRWNLDNCRPGSAPPEDDEGGDGQETPTPGPGNFVWTEPLKQGFREQLEKLVILDYIMRNTDRGLDNWMIRVDWETNEVSIASDPLQLNMDVVDRQEGPRPVDLSQMGPTPTRASYPYRAQQPMDVSSPRPSGSPGPKMSIGAIDNSLSWPWKHPDAWRSFPFGWLFLPVDLIGQPFSQKTKDHFLPLLTSTQWWTQTQLALRRCFQMDPDFQERMFAKQMAVMKGQAWNVVETLKTPDHGPLELTRRAKVCVWDDLVDVPIAVPMRATSSEMRRRADPNMHMAIQEEEMDIGASNSSAAAGAAQPVADLLGMASPPVDLPHPGRFELSLSPGELAGSPGPGMSPDGDESMFNSVDSLAKNEHAHAYARPRMPRSSLTGPPRTLHSASPRHERRYSFASAFGGRRGSNSIAQQLHGAGAGGDYYDDEDMDGDLGYAAAEGMEGNRRKVIVERLEPVKSKNPVFTWC